MKLGQKAMEALRAEITGELKAGDDLVVAGDIALSGTALITEKEKETLKSYFSEGFLWDAQRSPSLYGAYDAEVLLGDRENLTCEQMNGRKRACAEKSSVWEAARNMGADALYILGTGGVLAGLWKMAEAGETGIQADLRKIPVRQETIEICERFDLNPYRLFSEGALLIGTQNGAELELFCRQKGIPAAVIGKAVKGNDRLLYSGENCRYLERPAEDELTKFSWGSSWKNKGLLPGKDKNRKNHKRNPDKGNTGILSEKDK